MSKLNTCKSLLIFIGSLFALAILVGGYFAFTGFGSAHAATTNKTWGPFAHSSLDSSTCGNNWAVDHYNLTFERLGPRHYELHWNQGTFKTLAGVSPGACDGPNHDGNVSSPGNGQTIHADEKGSNTFHGNMFFKVAGGTYHGDVVCSSSTCTGSSTTETVSRFVGLVYGVAIVKVNDGACVPDASTACVTTGSWCFLYHGGDSDSDAGDLHQQASTNNSCSALGAGYRGDIFGPLDV